MVLQGTNNVTMFHHWRASNQIL